tara:strand:- start:1351 stop:1569 length:219 start_codon:yes stop_codon:yes gene_type:complete
MLIRVITQNTPSGNPRRGWVHVNEHGNFLAFIDEGYTGTESIQQLRNAGVAESISLNITPKEYNQLKKRKAN